MRNSDMHTMIAHVTHMYMYIMSCHVCVCVKVCAWQCGQSCSVCSRSVAWNAEWRYRVVRADVVLEGVGVTRR